MFFNDSCQTIQDMPTLDLSTLMNEVPPENQTETNLTPSEILEPLRNFLVEHLRSIGGHAALIDAKRAAYANLKDLKQTFEQAEVNGLKEALNHFVDQFEWGRSRLYGGRLAVGIKGVLRVSEATFFSDSEDSQDDDGKFTEDEDEDKDKANVEPQPIVFPPLPPPQAPSSTNHHVLILDIDKTLVDFCQISNTVVKQHFDKILSLCRTGDEKGGPSACIIYRPSEEKNSIFRAYEVPRRTQLEECKLYLYQVEKITNDSGTGVWLIKKRPQLHHFLQVCSRRFHELRVASQAGPEWLAAVIPFIDPEREFFQFNFEKTVAHKRPKTVLTKSVVSFASNGTGDGPHSNNPRTKMISAVCPDLIEVTADNKMKWRDGVKFSIIDDYPEIWTDCDRPFVKNIVPCNFFENWYNVGHGWNNNESCSEGFPIPVDKDDSLLKWLENNLPVST